MSKLTDPKTCDIDMLRYISAQIVGGVRVYDPDKKETVSWNEYHPGLIMMRDGMIWHPDANYDQLRMVEEKVGHSLHCTYRKDFNDWCASSFGGPSITTDESELLARLRLACIVYKEKRNGNC